MEILKEIVKFMTLYWREIVAVSVSVISLFIAIFRKKPKQVLNILDAMLVYLDEILPRLINNAEVLPGLKGKDKLALVIESSSQELVKKFGYCLDTELITSRIESFLSTPESKRKELTK